MALSKKHKAFVEEYLVSFNATEAYHRVYGPRSRETAASNGYRLLRNAEISAAIKQRLSETAMSADEVLMRLAEQARGSIEHFVQITPAGPIFDFRAAQDADKLNLIKKLKTKTRTYVKSGQPIEEDGDTKPVEDADDEDALVDDEDALVIEVDVEFELYDAQAALVQLGRHHKLFTDRQEGTITHDVGDAAERLLGRIDRIAARVGASSGVEGDGADRTGGAGA